DGLRESLDLDRLRAARHVRGGVLAEDDLTDLEAGTGLEAERAQGCVVGECVGQRPLGVVGQEEEAVGLVDLLPAVGGKQIACEPIVAGIELGSGRGAELLDELRAVDEVGDEQGARLDHVPSMSARAVSYRRLPPAEPSSAPNRNRTSGASHL